MRYKASIITVVYNGVSTLESAIRSVLDQTGGDYEYIIIDGGSKDGSVDIIKKYEDRIAYWVSEPDKGLYDAMNKGIKAATGDIIGIVNADDELYSSEVIRKVLGAYRDENTMIVADTLMINGNREALFTVKARPKLYLQVPFMHTSCFIPRSCFERFGNYDISYKIGADVDLLMRLMTNGVNYAQIDMPSTKMRTGGLSDRQFIRGRGEYRKIYLKYFHNIFRAYYGYGLSLAMFYLAKLRRKL